MENCAGESPGKVKSFILSRPGWNFTVLLGPVSNTFFPDPDAGCALSRLMDKLVSSVEQYPSAQGICGKCRRDVVITACRTRIDTFPD